MKTQESWDRASLSSASRQVRHSSPAVEAPGPAAALAAQALPMASDKSHLARGWCPQGRLAVMTGCYMQARTPHLRVWSPRSIRGWSSLGLSSIRPGSAPDSCNHGHGRRSRTRSQVSVTDTVADTVTGVGRLREVVLADSWRHSSPGAKLQNNGSEAQRVNPKLPGQPWMSGPGRVPPAPGGLRTAVSRGTTGRPLWQ